MASIYLFLKASFPEYFSPGIVFFPAHILFGNCPLPYNLLSVPSGWEILPNRKSAIAGVGKVFLPRAIWVFITRWMGRTKLPTWKWACFGFIESRVPPVVTLAGPEQVISWASYGPRPGHSSCTDQICARFPLPAVWLWPSCSISLRPLFLVCPIEIFSIWEKYVW